MAIYFLRHGESKANEEGLFAGQKNDAELTANGLEQAKQAAKELKEVKIAPIITSQLIRAYQTAVNVAEVLGIDVEKIETDDRIMEYDMGSLTSTPIRKVTSQELAAADGAEDVLAFRERILGFLREHQNDAGNVLVVSHAGVGRAIEAAKQGLDPVEFYNLPAYPNGHAVRLDLDWLDL